MKLIEMAFFTTNLASMTAFYQQLLKTAPVVSSADMAIFMVDGTKILIHTAYIPAEGELPPSNHIAFAVDDVDATCDELIQRGLRLEVAPRDYYWGRSAYLRDPDQQQIEITKGD